jgi:hypothetical protein
MDRNQRRGIHGKKEDNILGKCARMCSNWAGVGTFTSHCGLTGCTLPIIWPYNPLILLYIWKLCCFYGRYRVTAEHSALSPYTSCWWGSMDAD